MRTGPPDSTRATAAARAVGSETSSCATRQTAVSSIYRNAPDIVAADHRSSLGVCYRQNVDNVTSGAIDLLERSQAMRSLCCVPARIMRGAFLGPIDAGTIAWRVITTGAQHSLVSCRTRDDARSHTSPRHGPCRAFRSTAGITATPASAPSTKMHAPDRDA